MINIRDFGNWTGITILSLIPSSLYAANPKISPFDVTNDTTILSYLRRTKNYLLGFAGGIAILFIIIGAVQMITSSGNPQRLETAKKTLTYAVIGLLAVLLSSVILGVIMGDFLPAVFNGSGDPYQ